jgi:hypothetical protein
MFVPSFFTGNLIRRFGASPGDGVGLALNLVCIVVALNGIELEHFLVALFTLGWAGTSSSSAARRWSRPPTGRRRRRGRRRRWTP